MYTDEEIEEAVGKIVRTSIRRQFGALGNRRTDLTFNDTKDAAAGVFILYPNAVFYTVFLAAKRLLTDVEATRSLVSQLVTAIAAADRRVTPVDDLTELANARAGLEALQSALQARLTAFKDRGNLPAYQRFEKSSKRFLDKVGAKIKEAGGIVMTPAEARAKIMKLFGELKTSFEALKKSATYLGTAVEDFERLDLPGLLSNTVIGNAQKVLGERLDELEGLTPDQRLLILRGVVLDVLAARSAVKGFTRLNPPTTFLELSGTGSVYADEDYPLEPATIYAELAGPYPILPARHDGSNGREYLEFLVDGTTSLTVNLLGSYVASLEGGIKGPFDIGDPNGLGQTTNKFTVIFRNYDTFGTDWQFDFELTPPAAPISAWDLSFLVNDQMGPGRPIKMEPYSNPLRLVRTMNIEVDTPTTASLRTGVVTDHRELGIKLGDHVIVKDPDSAHYGLQFEVTTLLITRIELTLASAITTITGGNENSIFIEVCAGHPAVRFVVASLDEHMDVRLDALYGSMSIFLPQSTQDNETWQQQALNTIGFIPVMESISTATRTKDLVKQFNATSSTSVGTTPRIEADFDFVPGYEGVARTDPNDFLKLVCSRLLERSKAMTVISGNDVTFATILAEEAEVHVGDSIVIRDHDDTSLIGVLGTVTEVTNASISATMESAVTSGTVDFETGPVFSELWSVTAGVFISGGSLNDGEYEVRARGTVPFELELAQPFPFPSGRGNQPIFFQASVGKFRAIFRSLSSALDSALRYELLSTGSATFSFTNEDFQEAVGTTVYFQLPEVPSGLEVDDVLELYDTQFNLPTFSSPIRSFDREKRVIELGNALPVSTPSYSFTLDSPVPFARVRKKRRATYDQLRKDIAAWLVRFDSQERYFLEISRALNGVTTNKNPTIIQTGDARQRVVALSNNLDQLVAGLNAYTADVVPEVDAIVKAFQEKGADRAVSLLLAARMNEFFSLTQEEASFAGNLMKAIRDVEKNDLPVKKTGRDGASRAVSSTLASYDEVDFEFDQSDIDSVPEPDSPGTQGAPLPGNVY